MVLFVLILFFPFVWDRMHFFRFPRLFSFVFFLGLFMKQISKWISLLGQRRRRDNRSKQIGETNALSFLIFFSLKKKILRSSKKIHQFIPSRPRCGFAGRMRRNCSPCSRVARNCVVDLLQWRQQTRFDCFRWIHRNPLALSPFRLPN